MALGNTKLRYGGVARGFHWLSALLILSTFGLGLWAENAPFGDAAALAQKVQLFTWHKTLGITAFFLALARILWALVNPRPVALHPARKLETFAAEAVHWSLYIAIIAVPLTGWIHHAASEGFAPIWWPFGQNLPMVPKSEALSSLFSQAHWFANLVLLGAVGLHIAGALKHLLIDRDATVARMTRGVAAGDPQTRHSGWPLGVALLVYAAIVGLTLQTGSGGGEVAQAPLSDPGAAVETAPGAGDSIGNWRMIQGEIHLGVTQMGSAVSGTLPAFAAEITFDPEITEGPAGQVRVTIDTPALSLGSVTAQAKEADFFDVAAYPLAVFEAPILRSGAGYEAQGRLSLRGHDVAVRLPFTLEITGDLAKMSATTRLDRRDFGMGANYQDEQMVGFGVDVRITLEAERLR